MSRSAFPTARRQPQMVNVTAVDTPPTYESAIKIHRPQPNNVHSLQEKKQVRF